MRSRSSSVRLPHCSFTFPFISFHFPFKTSVFMGPFLSPRVHQRPRMSGDCPAPLEPHWGRDVAHREENASPVPSPPDVSAVRASPARATERVSLTGKHRGHREAATGATPCSSANVRDADLV